MGPRSKIILSSLDGRKEAHQYVVITVSNGNTDGTVGGRCLADGSCLAPNTICTNNFICECIPNYFVNSRQQCELMMNTSLATPASTPGPQGSTTTPPRTWPPLLGQCPTGDGLCGDPNAQCVNGTCVCHSSFYLANNFCKSKGELNAPCFCGLCIDPNAVCSEPITICQCRRTYYEKAGQCRRKLYIGQSCSDGDVCDDVNAQCLAGKCSCSTSYQEENGACVQSGSVGSRCRSSATGSPCTDQEAICLSDVCACRPGFYRSYDNKCIMKLPLGARCTVDDVCIADNSICQDARFVCRSTHYSINGTCAARGLLGAPCILAPSYGDGCLQAGLYCSAGICSCRPEYYPRNGTCVPRIPLSQQCDPTAADRQCLDDNSACSNNRCLCRNGFLSIAGLCIQNVTLGTVLGPCTNTTSCFDEKTQCTRGVCSCRDGYFYKAGVCLPKLTMSSACAADDVCFDANSVCVGGKCQCSNNFYPDATGKFCRAKGELDGPCFRVVVCLTPHSICSLDRCICSEGFFNLSGLCVPKVRLWGSCSEGQLCSDTNVVCFDGQCQCAEGFYDNNRSMCVPKASVGEICSLGADRCSDDNSDCVGGRCVCRQNFTTQGIQCKSTDVAGRLFADCLTGGTCSVVNAICRNNSCLCPRTHFAAFGQCVPKIQLRERCDVNRDVCSDPNSVCRNGLCTCESEYYESHQRCVSLGTFGAACLFGVQCQTINSLCVNGYCVCQNGYFFRNEVCLPKIAVDKECVTGDACLDANADCTSAQRCQCRSGYITSFGHCVLLVSVGQACDVDSICSDLNAMCLNGFCQCIRGFEMTIDKKSCRVQTSVGVIPGSLDGVCLAGNTCSPPQLICTITGFCACDLQYYKVQGQCVSKVNLNDPCSESNQCLERHAVCDSGRCVCPRNLVRQNNACVLSTNHSLVACSSVSNCPYPHAACVGGYCTCLTDYWLLAGQCYDQSQIVLNIECTNDASCSPPSTCVGGLCLCPAGYYAATSGGCYATIILGASCSASDVCADHHAVCSSSSGGICICQPNYQAESGICVSSSLNASLIACSSVSNCPFAHAVCAGGFCGCDAGFKYRSGHCYVGLGDACGSGDLCSDENAVCSDSGVCACKSDYRSESDKCVLVSTAGVGSALFGLDPALGIFLLILAILAALLLLLLLLCCLVYCCRRCRKVKKDSYERKLMETESIASESNTLNKVAHQGQLNSGYQATTSSSHDRASAAAAATRSAQHQRHLQHQQQQQQRVMNGSRSTEMVQATEMYSIEDLPRVMHLNREEIRGDDSARVSANEELDTDTDSSYQYRLVNRSGGPSYMTAANHHHDHADGRQAVSSSSSSSRRQMAAASYSASAEDARAGERRLVTMSSIGGTSVSTPSTIHRNVSAFGEITVMPVGDEDEHLRISVGEEII